MKQEFEIDPELKKENNFFIERKIRTREIREERIKKEMVWGEFSGTMNNLTKEDRKNDWKIDKDPYFLTSVEKAIINYIHDLIERRSKQPIIIADFSGGVGLSMLKVAELFEKEVHFGEVVFIVSNWEMTEPDTQRVASNSLTNIEVMQFNRTYPKRLVKYIKADTSEFKEAEIEVHGKVIKLQGNIDLLTESLSLMHSLIPEEDFPNLFSMLSKDGAIILTSNGPHIDAGNEDFEEILVELFPKAIKQAAEENNLIGTLKETEDSEDYKVYQKPGTPEIRR